MGTEIRNGDLVMDDNTVTFFTAQFNRVYDKIDNIKDELKNDIHEVKRTAVTREEMQQTINSCEGRNHKKAQPGLHPVVKKILLGLGVAIGGVIVALAKGCS